MKYIVGILLSVYLAFYGILHYRIMQTMDSVEEQTPSGRSKDVVRVEQEHWLHEDRISSVDYFACCGAGHRVVKLGDAYYVARLLNFSLRIFFGFCNKQEMFSYLFGPPIGVTNTVLLPATSQETANNKIPDMYIKISNEVPGFQKLIRWGNLSESTHTASCPCGNATRHFETDLVLFHKLRDRFRDRARIEAYMNNNNFADRTVIGLHVRAGNNEQGNFIIKNRTLHNISSWCENVADRLLRISENFILPSLVFIATDSVDIISILRNLLKDKMEVISLPQHRLDRGEGVFFGVSGNVTDHGNECMKNWLDTYSDMMLLSHADVLVAGRPSSFTQGLPMTMVLSTNKRDRKVKKSFCEVNMEATQIICFEDLMDWCCNGTTSFSLGSIQKYDYQKIRESAGTDLVQMYLKKLKMRPTLFKACVPTTDFFPDCLPYLMPQPRRRKSKTGNA